MCGIAGIIAKVPGKVDVREKIRHMSALLSHRGPDGEGFITIANGSPSAWRSENFTLTNLKHLLYISQVPIGQAPANCEAAFAHRRLAIIDLSDSGHQPMCDNSATCWITFNGEIYNYLELRNQLQSLGHRFASGSDTEVVLAAYKEWGTNCVNQFNGMWAFCLYDKSSGTFFASRDRLGVKPFYYLVNDNLLAFASEQKALTGAGLVTASANHNTLHNYLVNGLLETETANFFEGISELWPGFNLTYNLHSGELHTRPYFHLNDIVNTSNDTLSENELVEKLEQCLIRAVELRLRSDVEVGTCLSGGIDSSALATIMGSLTHKPVHCFTSVFPGHNINEETYAALVVKKINGRHFKINPSPDAFVKEADALIYSQDVPIWSTSTYAQYKVMQLAKSTGIKVVLDGQGADELFGGYHHHFVAKWNNLRAQGKMVGLFQDIFTSRKTIPSPFLFYLKQLLKRHVSAANRAPAFLKKEFVGSGTAIRLAPDFDSVNAQLTDDIYNTRLKTFLKCEDRCGMWHSVESRTPFSDDIDLIRLMFSFDGNKKLQNGVSKYLLREATKKFLPPAIYNRHDKKGFETPMNEWLATLKPRLLEEISAADFNFVNLEALKENLQSNNPAYAQVFKLFVLARWKVLFAAPPTLPPL